jgi:hypothetical protein
MTAPQMVCHVSEQMRQALGEMQAQPVSGPLAHLPLNWLVIHLLPWPKGRAASPPEFLQRSPEWEHDLAELKRLVNAFSARGDAAQWPPSPVFGRISGRSWGVLTYRHLDHHLRQFGV